jgi:hypothetical protein
MQFACGTIGYFKFIDDKEGATEVPPLLFCFDCYGNFPQQKLLTIIIYYNY